MSGLTTDFLKFLEELPTEEKINLEIDSKQISFHKEQLNERVR